MHGAAQQPGQAPPASSSDVVPSRRVVAALLTIVLLGAALPRFWNVWSQGVECYDASNLTLEAQLVVTVIDAVAHKVSGREYSLPELDQVRGRPMSYAKPTYTLSLVPGWYVGAARTHLAPVMAALWGLGTVVIVYLLGRELWGPVAGLLAAAMVGASGFAAFYSRVGAAESFGFFCTAVALWLYARLYDAPSDRPRRWYAMLVGFAWALAILANYKLIILAAVVLSISELAAIITRGWRIAARSTVIASALFGTLILTEIAFRGAVFLWRRIGGEFSAMTYWEQFRYSVFEKRSAAERFDVDLLANLESFGQYWWRAESFVLPLLAAAGIVWAVARPGRFKKADGPLAMATVAATILWSLQHFVVPRAMAALCVLLALFAGFALERMAAALRLDRKPVGVVVFVAGYAVLLSAMVYRIGPAWFSQPSGYLELSATVASAGDAPLFAYWRQKPTTALYVLDRPILQINDEPGVGDYNLGNMPSEGLLVAESDYLARHYPDAEVLGRWRTRAGGNELALAEELWSWRDSVARRGANIEVELVRLGGPARVELPRAPAAAPASP